jgi:hypothetical protein
LLASVVRRLLSQKRRGTISMIYYVGIRVKRGLCRGRCGRDGESSAGEHSRRPRRLVSAQLASCPVHPSPQNYNPLLETIHADSVSVLSAHNRPPSHAFSVNRRRRCSIGQKLQGRSIGSYFPKNQNKASEFSLESQM